MGRAAMLSPVTTSTAPDPCAAPGWRVLLLGGAGGVGKTSVSYRVARHFGAGPTEVDRAVIEQAACGAKRAR